MRVILLGSPGSGKGTQAQNISKRYHIPQISTGDMLRAVVKSDSPRAEQFRQIMQSGMLVSDDLILELVDERVKEPDCCNGYLLDGFPRTIPQAQAIQARGIEIDYIIEIDVADAEIIHRLSGRRVHVNSGRIYHLDYNPPLVAGQDDVTGEPLVQRADDQEDTVRKRLEVYHEQTQPLVEFYQHLASQPNATLRFATISGVGSVGEISRKIFALLGEPK